MSKKMSVIVPVYNGEAFIEKCIDQLDNQTLDDVEIIIVNDGSEDKTYEIASNYKTKKQTLKVLNANHMGVSNARNIGISEATGEYITFVDVDDQYDLDLLETYYLAASKNGVEVVCIEKNSELANKIYSDNDAIKFLLNAQIDMSCWNKAFRKELCANMYDVSMRIYEDYLAVYEIFKKANSILVINADKYHYITREGSSSKAKKFSEKYFDAIKAVDYTYEDVSKSFPQLVEYAASRKYNTYLRIVKIYYRRNGYKSKIYKSKILKIYEDLKTIDRKKLKIVFGKKTELIRYRVLMTSKFLFKVLVKTIDKK